MRVDGLKKIMRTSLMGCKSRAYELTKGQKSHAYELMDQKNHKSHAYKLAE